MASKVDSVTACCSVEAELFMKASRLAKVHVPLECVPVRLNERLNLRSTPNRSEFREATYELIFCS